MGEINVNINDLHFHVYPNPSSDLIVVSLTDAERKNLTLELYNSEGMLVHKNHQTSGGGFIENISTLPAGIYILKLSNESSMAVQKVVITR